MINRFSSSRQRLDRHCLNERLQGALGYDRIASFFSSAILAVAGEALEAMPGTVRMACNSQIDAHDVMIAKKAAQAAMQREWCDLQPEKVTGEVASHRFSRLHDFLMTGKPQGSGAAGCSAWTDSRQGWRHYPGGWAEDRIPRQHERVDDGVATQPRTAVGQ